MSLSSEKIYKRKPSIIVRQQLLQVLLRKYIKKVYFGVLIDKKTKQQQQPQQQQQQQQQTNNHTTSTIAESTTKLVSDRQLLRQEYYNDIYECLINYCKLNNIASARLTETLDRFTTLTSRREFIESIKKKRSNKTTVNPTTDNNDAAESDKGEVSRWVHKNIRWCCCCWCYSRRRAKSVCVMMMQVEETFNIYRRANSIMKWHKKWCLEQIRNKNCTSSVCVCVFVPYLTLIRMWFRHYLFFPAHKTSSSIEEYCFLDQMTGSFFFLVGGKVLFQTWAMMC